MYLAKASLAPENGYLHFVGVFVQHEAVVSSCCNFTTEIPVHSHHRFNHRYACIRDGIIKNSNSHGQKKLCDEVEIIVPMARRICEKVENGGESDLG